MHVLYFHQYFTTPQGSGGLRSYQMARRLIERGHQVTMVCGSRGRSHTGLTGEPVHGIRTGETDGIRIIEVCIPYSNYDSLPRRSVTFLRLACRNVRIARKTSYDLLFATSTPLTAGIPGIAMRLMKPRKPFVFEVRDLWPDLPKAMGVVTNPAVLCSMSILERLTYRCANGIVGLSPGVQEGIKSRSGRSKRVVMIPNACDLDLFSKPVPMPMHVLSALCQRDMNSTFRAVFTGAHGMANGLDAVLDAAAVLKSRGRSDVQLLFIGDGKTKPKLVQRAAEEGLDNCIFLDYMPKTDLAGLMCHMHIGLMILANVPAFYYGTSPNKFFDYISSALPVLNNYPGWLADMIKEHNCGVVVPPDEPTAFADALSKLADEPGPLKDMGLNARALAESSFDRSKLADDFVGFLETVYAASNGRTSES